MSLITNKRLFYIDSHNRLSGTHSNFSYNIDYNNEDYDHCVVLQISIPKSYYLIQNGKNTFTLKENSNQATITIPIGNYSRSSFAFQLQHLLNTLSPNGWTYQISIPNNQQTGDTGLYTWTVTGNSGSQPSFIVGNYVYEQLGFEPNSTNVFVGDVLSSVNVVKFQLEDSLFLHSDIATNGIDNVLQEMLGVQNTDYSNIIFTCPDVEAYAKPITTNNNNIYNFSLSDEDGYEINLNGQNIVFTLMLFKKDPMNKLVKQFLKVALMDNFLN